MCLSERSVSLMFPLIHHERKAKKKSSSLGIRLGVLIARAVPRRVTYGPAKVQEEPV